ncbi:indolepyruvate oxidoreductase subunit beta [Candidatus Hadarchaeum sp.]|uniref:indolepyruvate oxidoreductase subunit beta n=1 Tax=Candidatus Hadarchaeum sp. TaxID=2883567 RepID=UPI003D13C8D5
MSDEFNCIIVGVGGQGGATLTNVIAEAATRKGLRGRMHETLGMAQRGGSVQVQIRLGSQVYSSFIPPGQADVLIALDPNEALRAADYVGEKTTIIMNTNGILPVSVLMGKEKYPDLKEEISLLKQLGKEVYAYDAYGLAKQAGSLRAMSVVLLGSLAKLGVSPFTRDELYQAMVDTVPKKYLNENIAAFNAGEKEIEKLMGR